MNSLLGTGRTVLRLLVAGATVAYCRHVEDRPGHRGINRIVNELAGQGLIGRELARAAAIGRRNATAASRGAASLRGSPQRSASVGSHGGLVRRSGRQTPPNILYILADDLGYADVGYHNSEIKTPNIDKLAAEGVKLEGFYTNPICSATRASIMTGRYTHRLGFQHFNPPRALGGAGAVPLKEKFLPQYLKEAGYATHSVGKWHLGLIKKAYLPTQRGFDTHFGFYEGGVQYYDHTIGGHLDLHLEEDGIAHCTGMFKGTYDMELFTRRAGKIIDDHNVSTPLFMYLAYHSPHTPNACPQKYFDMYAHLTDDAATYRRVFCGMVTAMDTGVGITVQQWKDKGEAFWKNSIIIFHSDNGGPTYDKGGALNFPLRGGKLGLFEGSLRVASFFVSPLFQSEVVGTTVKGLIHVTDMLPTLVGRTDVKVTDHNLKLDGFDQWETISAGVLSPRTTIVHALDPLGNEQLKDGGPVIVGCETSGPFFSREGKCEMSAAIRHNEWKLIVGMNAKCLATENLHRACSRFNYGDQSDNKTINRESLAVVKDTDGKPLAAALFNIETDPNEESSVAKENPTVVQELMQKLLDETKSEIHLPQWPPYRTCDSPCNSCAFRPDLFMVATITRGCVGPFVPNVLASSMACVEPAVSLPYGVTKEDLNDFWE